MKKYILSIFIALTLVLWTGTAFSQSVPPPPSNHGESGNQAPGGGGAPIGGGLFILLGLGAAYGGAKGLKKFKEEHKINS